MMIQVRLFRSLFHSTSQHSAAPKSALAKLRKKTGYSLSLCKQALETTEQDLAKAENWLKEQALAQGWAKAQKLEGRNATQGLIGVLVKDKSASMIELNCETDFVARNKEFHILLNKISGINLANAPSTDDDNEVAVKKTSNEELLNMRTQDGQKVADLMALNIGQIGENIVLRRGLTITVGESLSVEGVTHPSAHPDSVGNVQYGRYGSLVTYVKNEGVGLIPENQTPASLARQICQHVIGMNPVSVGNMADIPPLRTEEERQAAFNEKEAKMLEMEAAEGLDIQEMKKDLKKDPELLIHQDFLLEQEKTVGELLLETGMEIKDVYRFELGQETQE